MRPKKPQVNKHTERSAGRMSPEGRPRVWGGAWFLVMAWEPDVPSDCCVLAGSLSDPEKQTGNHMGTEFRQGVGREMLIG